MKLPKMINPDGIRRTVQEEFGGYEHRAAARDGAIYDMMNLCSDRFPLLSPREPRYDMGSVSKPRGIGASGGALYMVCDAGAGFGFYLNGEFKGELNGTEQQFERRERVFANMGAYVAIWPDKKVYNKATDTLENIESEITGFVDFLHSGELYGEEAEDNSLRMPAHDLREFFRVGDAVTIIGCVTHPENNKTAIIREISEDGGTLRFYEYAFETGGERYQEAEPVTLRRTAPELDWVCANENRLWGCKGDTIYASKLGDPFNWNVFDGLSTDSWAADAGSAGDFTGCISYLGYPVFFKEDAIYKVYGTEPRNFQLMGSATLGVEKYSGRSLAIAGETLFYLSRVGVVAYTGGVPTPICAGFGDDKYSFGVAGSDGLKYYIRMRNNESYTFPLFVYDTQRGLWHKEDFGGREIGMTTADGVLYLLRDNGRLCTLGAPKSPPAGGVREGAVAWSAEFADFYEGSPDKKDLKKLLVRLELDEGSSVRVYIRYDSVGDWERIDVLHADVKRSYYIPVVPRRADHLRLRLAGEGACRIYSITREYAGGSPLRSRGARN